MRIRSVTLGVGVGWPVRGEEIARAGRWLGAARRRFEEAGVVVQTTRLALAPVAELDGAEPEGLARFGRELEAACREAEIGYVSVGPISWGRLGAEAAERYAERVPELIAATETVFGTIETAAEGQVQGGAVAVAGRVVARVAAETELGFGNLRFGTIAECPPGIPFFPAAYHGGGPPRLSLALEGADTARAAVAGSGGLAEVERRLDAEFGGEIRRLEAVALELEGELGVAYGGVDVTPAPFPTDEISAGGVLEDLGVGAVGAAGTLAAAAALTGMLKRLRVRTCGFGGLMLPVLEDSVLARRASGGLLSWPELLLYSAVCGTGLDTVPLPGDASEDELALMVLDVSALAVALRKPLTCRLLPVPGKRAGEMTEYDFPFFVNARVLPLKGYADRRLLDRLMVDGPE